MTTRFSSRSVLMFILVPMLLFQLTGASLYFVALPGYSSFLYPATKILMLAWPLDGISQDFALPFIKVQKELGSFWSLFGNSFLHDHYSHVLSVRAFLPLFRSSAPGGCRDIRYLELVHPIRHFSLSLSFSF